ncbi:hypothetical protein PM082_020734 [Marasmius tenuissimus]|nr:hypothetical protein PM082_020734 [Marasmius tenuissimus]
MKRLRVIIIGGGVAGLTAAYCLGRAGHHVIVLERHKVISEIGAGIQVGPNMSRLLIRWGLGEKLSQLAVKPEFLTFHRYENGERLGHSWFGDQMAADHGAPYYHVHRADLIQMLYDLAKPYMDLKLGCRAVSVDPSHPSVQVEDGSKFHGDLIIGADGFRSMTRETIVPGRSQLKAVGDVAYRVLLPAELLLQDPALCELIKVPHIRCWMGPERHVVAYMVGGGKHYNVVLIAPDVDHANSTGSWIADGSLTELRALYTGWDWRVQKLLALATSCLKTKVAYMEPLPSWTHPSMKVVLVGDACHPMLPYRAQAAALAVEDCAVLGVLFSKITDVAEIPELLRAYQVLRAPRATSTLQASLLNRSIFHLDDGGEQESRDRSMKVSMEDAMDRTGARSSVHAGNANLWADKQRNQEQFDYDAESVADAWCKLRPKARL